MTEAHFQLAQVNIARFAKAKDNAANADFFAALDAVNARAEAADGFIWRLKGDGNDSTDVLVEDDPELIINLSVWRDVEALKKFVYSDEAHFGVMKRRKEWFEPIAVSHALWWIPAHEFPEVDEAMIKLAAIEDHGPSKAAFTFAQIFAPPMLETPPAIVTVSSEDAQA